MLKEEAAEADSEDAHDAGDRVVIHDPPPCEPRPQKVYPERGHGQT
jgi:hypothetical protein